MPCGRRQRSLRASCRRGRARASPGKLGADCGGRRHGSEGLMDFLCEAEQAIARKPLTELPAWDVSRFGFLQALPAQMRSGRSVELYTDDSTGQKVVVKRLPHVHGRENTPLQEAWPEVELIQRLGKQNFRGVCQYHGAYHDERSDLLIVTEYIPGGDLFDLADSLGPPGLRREVRALPVIHALLRALLELHECGVAHGDVSLENALRRPDHHNEIVLIDFEEAVAGRPYLQRGRHGKPSYQAPEMHGPAPYDPFAADLFACGVAIYGLALGAYPWKATSPRVCRRFAYFQEYGLHAFLRNITISHDGFAKPVAEYLSPYLVKLLGMLLDLNPAHRFGVSSLMR